jgi:hypothetical protein
MLSLPAHSFITRSQRQLATPYEDERLYRFPEPRSPASDVKNIGSLLAEFPVADKAVLALLRPTAFVTPRSPTAMLSGHWLAQEMPLATTGTAELAELARERGWTSAPGSGPVIYFIAPFQDGSEDSAGVVPPIE